MPQTNVNSWEETAEILMHLMHYFLSFGLQWEKKQKSLVAKGLPRKYIILEACRGTRVTECLQHLQKLLICSIPKAVASSAEVLDVKVSTARFIMISCSMCGIHATIRFRRQNFPFRLFCILSGEQDQLNQVLQTPQCMHDALTSTFLTTYDAWP